MAPPGKSTPAGGVRAKAKVKSISGDSSDDEYRRRRDRNNLAVKKSRVKSRQKTQETIMRVQQLKTENDQLEEKIKLLTKELSFLKDLFLAHAGSAHGVNPTDIDLEVLLAETEIEGGGGTTIPSSLEVASSSSSAPIKSPTSPDSTPVMKFT